MKRLQIMGTILGSTLFVFGCGRSETEVINVPDDNPYQVTDQQRAEMNAAAEESADLMDEDTGG